MWFWYISTLWIKIVWNFDFKEYKMPRLIISNHLVLIQTWIFIRITNKKEWRIFVYNRIWIKDLIYIYFRKFFIANWINSYDIYVYIIFHIIWIRLWITIIIIEIQSLNKIVQICEIKWSWRSVDITVSKYYLSRKYLCQ